MIPVEQFCNFNWCTYKQSGSGVVRIPIKEDSYCLYLEIDVRSDGFVFFRLEDYKKAVLGDKRRGESDCDLTFIEDQQVYQFEVKNTRKLHGVKDKAIEQCHHGDKYLVEILNQIDPDNSYSLKQLNSKYVLLHIRQQRVNLVRGGQDISPRISNCDKEIVIVRVVINTETHCGTANLREIIDLIEGL